MSRVSARRLPSVYRTATLVLLVLWAATPFPRAIRAAPAPYKFAALPASDPVVVQGNIVTDGAQVFWFDSVGTLHARELGSGKESLLLQGPARRSQLALANGVLVWSETSSAGGSIRAMRLATGEVLIIADGPEERNSPAIGGNTIAWRDHRKGNWDIYRYDLDRGEVLPVTEEGANQGLVAVTGDIIVWEDHRSGAWALRGYSLSQRSEFDLVSGDGDYLRPVAMGGAVAYTRRDPQGGFGSLIVRDLATGSDQIVAKDRPVGRVGVSSSLVVWEDWRDGLPNIYGFDRASGQEFVLSHSEQAREPALAANMVVWLNKSQFATRVAAVRLERPLPTDRVEPPTVPDATSRYFSETGHTLAEPFKSFWLQHDGLALFGYPITEPFDERIGGGTRRVQYFERARLEVDPTDSAKVVVGRLGAEAAQNRVLPTVAAFASTSERAYFSATGHSLAGAFKAYWDTQGGVSIFGYPVSEEMREKGLVVQYFERARFEFHPDAPAGQQVTLAQLGREALVARGWLPGATRTSTNR